MKINWKAIPDALKVLGKVVENNKSTILVGAGLLGWVGTAVLAAKAAPKAKTAIDKAVREKTEPGAEEPAELTPVETVKATWQYYIPAVGTGLVSSAAIIYAHKIDLDKIVSITASYQLSKGELKKLKDKIVEKDGEDKLEEYEKSVHSDILSAGPPTAIYNTGNGTMIFYDPTSGLYFYSDLWYVENALRSMLQMCKDDGTCDLAELRQNLGLPRNKTEGDYAFFYESVKDVDPNRIPLFLFEYHDTDAENGDSRPCVWLKIFDRIYNKYDYAYREDEDGGYFRKRRR